MSSWTTLKDWHDYTHAPHHFCCMSDSKMHSPNSARQELLTGTDSSFQTAEGVFFVNCEKSCRLLLMDPLLRVCCKLNDKCRLCTVVVHKPPKQCTSEWRMHTDVARCNAVIIIRQFFTEIRNRFGAVLPYRSAKKVRSPKIPKVRSPRLSRPQHNLNSNWSVHAWRMRQANLYIQRRKEQSLSISE